MKPRVHGHSLLLAAASILILLILSIGSVAPAAADPTVTQVMSGLDNPRGLAFGPEGALYVAEAGRGGFGLPNPPCFTGQVGASRCYGLTGAVSRLWRGVQERVATGFPSQARASDGGNAIGPDDIAMLGVGSAHVTIGLMQPPNYVSTYGLAGMAALAQVEPSGEWRYVADLGAYEAINNPDGTPPFGTPNGPGRPDSDPFGLVATPAGDVVTDAGGNTLLRVGTNGDISTLAVFQSRGTDPPRSTDSVPTSVAIGPDGAYYVGELSGTPFAAGAANIYRVEPGQAPQLFLAGDACLKGFTTIIDIAFDSDGNLYVLEYTTGTLIRITPDRSQPGGICAQYQNGARETVLTGLSQPTSVVVGPDGALYITNHGAGGVGPPPDYAGIGQVLRVMP
jgi:sugar lactone lactonase YvrE